MELFYPKKEDLYISLCDSPPVRLPLSPHTYYCATALETYTIVKAAYSKMCVLNGYYVK